MTSRLVDTRVPAEREVVQAWSEERFLELGFDGEAAFCLAWFGVDWHDAARLLDAGCPHELVLQILV